MYRMKENLSAAVNFSFDDPNSKSQKKALAGNQVICVAS